MRKLLKFGHSMTAITFLGSAVVLWVFHHYLPPPAEALEIYVAERQVMERVATLVMMPSLLLTLLFGLASFAAVPGYNDAPWAWGGIDYHCADAGGEPFGHPKSDQTRG